MSKSRNIADLGSNDVIETTASGVDVTGTVTADGLTVDGDGIFQTDNGGVVRLENNTSLSAGEVVGDLQFYSNDTSINATGIKARIIAKAENTSGTNIGLTIGTSDSTSGTAVDRVNISSNGDVSFYEDTGTTAKFVWDASAESLGIGTSSPLSLLDARASGTSTPSVITLVGTNSGASASCISQIKSSESSAGSGSSEMSFHTRAAGGAFNTPTERMRIDSSGNVGIGTTSLTSNSIIKEIHVDSSTTNGLSRLRLSASGESQEATISMNGYLGQDSLVFGLGSSGDGSATERMRINSSGNVGIGTASPSEKLESVTTDNTQSALSLYETTIGGESKLDFKVRNNGSNPIVMARISSDMSSGSVGSEAGDLRFHTTSAGSNQERARIDSSGNLLVGTTDINVYNGTSTGVALTGSGYIFAGKSFDAPMYLNRISNDGAIITFNRDGSTVGSITAHGTRIGFGGGSTGLRIHDDITSVLPYNPSTGGNQFGTVSLGHSATKFKDLYLSGGVITSSDYRLKDDVQPMQSCADIVKQMNLVNFAWKDSGEREDGFIAHELQALVPVAVRGEKDAVGEDGNEQYQGVDPLKLIPVLTKALQEALERIETLENK